MIVDRRYLIEENVEDVQNEIIELLDEVKADRPNFSYDLRELWSVPPTMTDRDAPVVKSVEAAIKTVLDVQAEFVVSPGTYDQKHIDRIGRLKNCIAYGPGLLELAHKPDEYIDVDDMLASAKVMGLCLVDILTDSGSMGGNQ